MKGCFVIDCDTDRAERVTIATVYPGTDEDGEGCLMVGREMTVHEKLDALLLGLEAIVPAACSEAGIDMDKYGARMRRELCQKVSRHLLRD